jgi:CBS domain-containing protein
VRDWSGARATRNDFGHEPGDSRLSRLCRLSIERMILTQSGEILMQVKDLMTAEPAFCTQHSSLVDVARMMRDYDCGAIPVVDDASVGKKLIGIITDRDIVVRGLAHGNGAAASSAGDCMSLVVATVSLDDSLEDCAQLMETHQIRRIPVVDYGGNCCGIVSQADLARNAQLRDIGRVVREVSLPLGSPV